MNAAFIYFSIAVVVMFITVASLFYLLSTVSIYFSIAVVVMFISVASLFYLLSTVSVVNARSG